MKAKIVCFLFWAVRSTETEGTDQEDPLNLDLQETCSSPTALEAQVVFSHRLNCPKAYFLVLCVLYTQSACAAWPTDFLCQTHVWQKRLCRLQHSVPHPDWLPLQAQRIRLLKQSLIYSLALMMCLCYDFFFLSLFLFCSLVHTCTQTKPLPHG